MEIENLKDKVKNNFDILYLQKEFPDIKPKGQRFEGKNNYANESYTINDRRNYNGHFNINSNNNHSYKIRNKKKDFHEKNDLKINIIKNVNMSTNPENIMKFNKFNLKNYYQNINRKKNSLVKINENSESDTESIKKKSKNIINEFAADYIIEKIHEINNNKNGNIDIIEYNEGKCENKKQNNKTAEKPNKKESVKNKKEQENVKNKDKNACLNIDLNVNKNENNFSNSSDNQGLIKLKNLNTNDTTSLKSSENSSLSQTHSFQLNYNTVINFYKTFRMMNWNIPLFYLRMKKSF